MADSILYKIDYSTEVSQDKSAFCALPDELLLEIGKHLFAGFGLEFWFQKGRKQPMFRAKAKYRPSSLRILRLCKTVRRKLLPLLDNMTESTLSIFNFSPFGSGDIDYSNRVRLGNMLSPAICGAIKKLELAMNTSFVPNPFTFKALEEITVYVGSMIILRDLSVLDDWATLLEIFRYALGEQFLPTPAFFAARSGMRVWSQVSQAPWIRDLANVLRISRPERHIQLLQAHQIGVLHALGTKRWGRVWHDLTEDSIVQKLSDAEARQTSGKSLEVEHVAGEFWKPPPTIGREWDLKPTSV